MTLLQKLTSWFRRPLSCEDVNQFIAAYLDDTLAPRARHLFEKHVARCPNCGPYLDQYVQTVELLQEQGVAAPPHPPDELIEATLHFLREHYDEL